MRNIVNELARAPSCHFAMLKQCFDGAASKTTKLIRPWLPLHSALQANSKLFFTYFVHSKMLGWINTFIRLNKISILNKIRERDFLIRNIIYTLCILLNPDVLKIMREISR